MSLTLLVGLGLPVFLVAAWAPPERFRWPAMLAVSLIVLAIASPIALALAVGLTAFVGRATRDAERKRGPLLLVLAVTVGAFVALKLGLQLGTAAGQAGVRLGFAFYSLRLLHYALDRYLGRQPAQSLGELLGYALYFPALWAGPIHRAPRFQRERRRRRWDAGNFGLGAERVLYGLVKITVLANYLVGERGTRILAEAELPAWQTALGELGCYGANLYLQFAGYSDVAIGVALMAGVRLEENFNWPIVATNIHDFWRRWHISLSDWCRDYVFVPVAALTRSGTLGVIASMIVLGVWHEPSARYLLWGVYHGAGIAAWRGFQKLKGEREPTHKALRWAGLAVGWFVTMAFVLLSFALTSQPTISAGLGVWATIFTLEA